MIPYRRSLGGRLMLLGMGLFFLSFGIGTIVSDPTTVLKLFSISSMLGVVAIIFAVPLSFSTDIFCKKTLFWLCVCPFLVWLIGPVIWDVVYLDGLKESSSMRTISFILAIISLLLASDPRSSSAPESENG